MTDTIDVAIVGAGPYGLSIAAHLSDLRVEHRIFGEPMGYWRRHMPIGMHLKSEGEASSLHDPAKSFPLERYCRENGVQYASIGLPVAINDFIGYGLAFQQRFAPNVENKKIVLIEKKGAEQFLLQFETGELTARRVIVATGLSHYQYTPPELSALPQQFVTHSSQHHDLSRFKDRTVVVLGAGSSAIDISTLLHEGGVDVLMLSRKNQAAIPDQLRIPRSLYERVRLPMSGIGPSWRSVFYAEAPHLFHALPENIRLPRAKRYLGPAGGYFMRSRFGWVPKLLGQSLRRADTHDGAARLLLVDGNGRESEVKADHIIAATGFRVDLEKLSMLSPTLRRELRSVQNTPVLSASFETSTPGLFFVGPASANSFGPVMRFAYGAKFAAPHLARFLAKGRKQ